MITRRNMPAALNVPPGSDTPALLPVGMPRRGGWESWLRAKPDVDRAFLATRSQPILRFSKQNFTNADLRILGKRLGKKG